MTGYFIFGFLCGLMWSVPAYFYGRIKAWEKATKLVEDAMKRIEGYYHA